jgi:AcrR family transcriptional regulator
MPDHQPPRRRLDPEVRRAEIVGAATRVFARTPYESVTIADIARESGASRSLILHYFEDKAGVFTAAIEAFVSRAAQHLRTMHSSHPAGRQAMMAANIEAVLSFSAAHRETVLALVPPGPSGPGLQRLIDELRDRIVNTMLMNNLGTTDVPVHVRFALRAYTGLFSVALGDWLRTGEPDREQVADFLTRTLMALVRDLVPQAA